MNDLSALTASRLHAKAARCREMAQQALSEGIADELRRIAQDYERDAAALEAGMPPQGLIGNA